MKKKLILTILCFGGISVNTLAQIDNQKTGSLNAILTTLYNVISGEKGEPRDWEVFKSLFHADAKLIPSGKDQAGLHFARFMTPEEYIEKSGPWLVENGFFEKEIHRKVDTFGNLTQVFSTYESFKSETDEKPFMRGINSIQLLNDGSRWWILNVYWMQESESSPIPSQYLPKE
ncbi:MAG: hypothetical protein AAF519_17685 [Bacteroidota bacterium]